MRTILPKSPRKEHWEALKYLQQDELLTPQEFLTRWQLTYKELASLTGCTIDQVKKWFYCKRSPYEIQRRLFKIDSLWKRLSEY